MDEFNVKPILRKFRFYTLCYDYVALLVPLLLLFFTENVFLFLLTGLLFFLLSTIIRAYLFNKHINSILFKELNPLKYNAVFEASKTVSNTLLEKIYFSYYTGDYQTVINICSAKLNDGKQKKYEYWYMIYLARAYFDLGDFENLKLIYDSFQTRTATDVKGEQIRNKYIFFKFIGLYLAGEFTQCKAFYEGVLSDTKIYNSKTPKLNEIQVKCSYAIACYRAQDVKTATEIFNYIVDEAPQLNYAVISKKYLDAIENGIEYQPEYIPVAVDENFELPKQLKSVKVRKIIATILLVLYIVCVFLNVVLVPDEPVHFKGLDYSTTRSDVKELYGEPDKTEEYVYPQGEFYDVYEAEFLGIKGELTFHYFQGKDDLFSARFMIDSKDFESYEEYKKAVNKTYRYFGKVLYKYQVWDQSKDGEINISWSRSTDKYAYSMYESQTSDTGYSNDFRDCTIFQFNKYPTLE